MIKMNTSSHPYTIQTRTIYFGLFNVRESMLIMLCIVLGLPNRGLLTPDCNTQYVYFVKRKKKKHVKNDIIVPRSMQIVFT